MDTALSSLFPIYKVGSDGFSWWIGQVENNKDDKNSGRVQVRIVGQHHREGDITATEDLPWANVMMPANVPYSDGGTTGATNNLQVGSWVVGFFLDVDCQKPLIIGSISHTKSSTLKDLQDLTPDLKSLGFKPTRSPGVIPAAHRSAAEQSGKDKSNAITEGGVVAAGTGVTKSIVPVLGALKAPESPVNPTGGKMCVEIADPNCKSEGLGDGVKRIIGDLLKNTQQSGGNVGSYYVSKINGQMYSAVDIPRKYVTKVNRLVTSFATRIKKEIIFAIRDAIEELIELIMGVESTKDLVAKGVDVSKYPKESYVPVTERGNFIKSVIDTFNKILNEVGCSFKKTIDDLIKFIINLLMNYLKEAITEAFCLIDSVVNSIVRYIDAAFSQLVETVLGPLQSLLGEAGSFLNVIGNTINKVLTLLGISCTGVKNECNKDKSRCTDGSNNDKKEPDFLDKLIQEIENGSISGQNLSQYGSFPVGVCDEAKSNPPQESTSVSFVGGVQTSKPVTSYVSTTTTIPDIPIRGQEFPDSGDLPKPVTDYRKNTDIFVEYKITAREKTINSGQTAIFDIAGPTRNGVLEVEVISGTIGIPQEEPYEECLVNSDDGLSVGLTVVPFRGVDENNSEVILIDILSPGKGYLIGQEFTISGSKVGGEDGVNDVTFRITKVGERIKYKIFGDVYEKKLVSSGVHPEFGEFIYSEPTSFSIGTNKLVNWDSPGYVGLEFTSKRAANSVVIWDEYPEDRFPEDLPELQLVTLNSDKENYKEGETINYVVQTIGYDSGTVFDYKIFGSVSESDYTLTDQDKKVLISDSTGNFFIFINIDEEKGETVENLTVILYEEGKERPVASKTVFIDAEEVEEVEEDEEPFKLGPDTTDEDLQKFLDEEDTEDKRDFGDQDGPDILGFPDPPEDPGYKEDDSGGSDPPTAGDPVTDEDGAVINIPILDPGTRKYQIPPKVIVSGSGYGAAAIALLDDNGLVSEIRVTRIGTGYKKNVPGEDNDKICVIDSFTVIRPGFGYKEPPKLYVDGDPNVGEIVIDENGFIIGVRVLNRSKSFKTIPDIAIVGGEGAGGFVLPSLVCLPQEELEQLEQKGYVKIGTGTYIDCP